MKLESIFYVLHIKLILECLILKNDVLLFVDKINHRIYLVASIISLLVLFLFPLYLPPSINSLPMAGTMFGETVSE